ncbi:mesencephalic astrocyte-derived neurotrophic factor homolog [Exaiptasia diaphana]|uniref:Mesencephalic astrocyte-derived neurotrophic factor homolog n=1 Tax=Exaiptasia diaphana TaxID=2652724 RepID=A0A913X2Y7_EXADI|nr:mesencephalic astrocyte-derived neurotrophic factor homolog [Exaiptasia diaphana]KXJ15780.1 Mesencephalic astrocyte-derived neurotrophic factor-like [Exaiptasia diaphana]
MKLYSLLVVAAILYLDFITVEGALKDKECEVCIKFLNKVKDSLTSEEEGDYKKIETKMRKACKKAKSKDNRFCYYIGGTEDAATGMLNEVTKPMSYSKPVEKICEALKSKDAQICELQYEQKIDLKNTNLKKLRVKQLKKILNDFDETCQGCVEKSDYIKKIEELMAQHSEL